MTGERVWLAFGIRTVTISIFSSRVFFSILTREPLQYSIFSHFIFLL